MQATQERQTEPVRARRLWAALIASLSVLVAGATIVVVQRARAHDRAEARERSVRDALAAHRLDEARRLIDRWTAVASSNGTPRYYRAWLEVASDRPVEAMDAMRAAMERGYPARPVLILRSVLQARAGQFDAAEPVLQDAFRDASEPRAEIAEGLTRIFLGTYRLAEASKSLSRWMKAAPQDARPYVWRNDIDERRGTEPNLLMQNDREALRRDPNLLATRLHLADLLLKAHRAEEAGAEYAELLARDSASPGAHNGAGHVALLKGDLQAAIRHFNEVLAQNPNNVVALRELALIDFRQGEYASSRDRFKRVVELEPFDVEVHYNYARALRLAGDDSLAAEETLYTDRLRNEQRRITELRQNLAQRPGDADLRSEVSRWLIEHGHETEGLEWAELTLRARPGHFPTCRLLAEYHTRKGNIGLANFYRSVASGDTEASSR
jgi:tetratricopeptide (TPR) repeat protein